MDIKDWIPHGKENAITREKLRKLTGYSDREIREMIERERRNGHAILSSPAVSGYWQTEDIDEIERFIKGYKVIQVKAHTRGIKQSVSDETEQNRVKAGG